jgi:hypothetical protein
MAEIAAEATGAGYGFGATDVVFSAVNGLYAEVLQVGDSAGAAAATAEGPAHDALGLWGAGRVNEV